MPTTLIGAALSSILPRIISEIEKKLKEKAEIKKEVDEMRKELRDIRDRIQRLNDTDGLQKSLIRSLRCLAYDMEVCLDCYDSATKTGRRKKVIEKIGKLNGPLKKAKDLYTTMLIAQGQRQREDGSSSSNTRAQASSNPGRIEQDQGNPLVDLVGNQENLRELLDLMRISERPLDMELKVIVISIVDFHGTGKTLLASHVYKKVMCYSESTQQRFSRHVFIDASNTDKNKVMKDIIEKLSKQEDGTGTTASNEGRQQAETAIHADPSSSNQGNQYMMNEDIQKRIKSSIGNNRYLIVVDNVPSEEMGSYITSAFPDNGTGSRIIITMPVAGSETMEISCCPAAGHVCNMGPLNADESVDKFLEEALMELPHAAAMEEAVTVAPVNICEVRQGKLRQFYGKKEWEKFIHEAEARWRCRMKQVLSHCYDSLSSHHQACLLYFSMFPRDRRIRRGSLIRRWKAEGPELGCTTDTKGTKNLQALIERNFVWPVQVSMMNNLDAKADEPQLPQVKTCQSPGLIHDYVIDKSESEEFVMLSCDERETTDIRRLSLHPGDSSSDGEQMLCEESMSGLRTLAIFRSNKHTKHLSFEKCDVLRVLDLEECHRLSPDHVKEICKFLELLKYLSLPPSIVEVPREIAKLKLLQTLELGKKDVVTVPADVLWLPNLKHLLGKCQLPPGYSKDKDLKKFLSGSGKKQNERSSLETLAGFVVGEEKGFPQLLADMAMLSKVKVWFNKPDDAVSRRKASHAVYKRNAPGLTESIMKFSQHTSEKGVGSGTLKIDLHKYSPKLLDDLKVTGCNLFYLKINCSWNQSHSDEMPLKPLTDFIAKQSVITKLCLSWITLDGSEILATLSELTGLRYLKLVADNIGGSIVLKGVGRSQTEVPIKTKPFQTLVRLCIVARKSLGSITVEPGALSKLVSLHIIYKDLHDASSNQISGLMNLKEVALHPDVKQETKDAWGKAALAHPMEPQVLFSVSP